MRNSMRGTASRAAGSGIGVPRVVSKQFVVAHQRSSVASSASKGQPESTPDFTPDFTPMVDRRSALLAGAASLLPLAAPPSQAAALAALPSLAAAAIPAVALTEGLSVSRIIKGCWQLSGAHRGDSSTDRTAGAPAVQDFGAFYDAGITAWDCADHYGPAEALIGRYLREHQQQAPNISVLTKLCVFSGMDMSTLNKDYISRAVDYSRSRLGVGRVDLMQFYWGDYSYSRFTDAFKYLGDSQAEGKVKALGVTNFDVPRMQQLVDTGVKLASNQLQYSLLDTRPENGMAEFCAANDIKLLPYGVLAGGFLSDKYLGMPLKQVDVDTSSKSKYGQVIIARGGWSWFQTLLQALDRVAKKHGSSIANVATKWVLDRPGVSAVILGARNATHVKDYAAVFNLSLDAEDLQDIQSALDRGVRPTGDCYQWERGLGKF